MSDKPANDEQVCPEHPDAEIEFGYGLAGGGIGAYTYCSHCGRILHKTQDDDEKMK